MVSSVVNEHQPADGQLSPAKCPITKVSLKWSMVEEDSLSILDKFRLLKDLGFDGVEFDAPDVLPTDEILAARDQTGLLIPGVINSRHWKTPLTHPDPTVRDACVVATIAAIEEAKVYGGDTVLLVPGVDRKSVV